LYLRQPFISETTKLLAQLSAKPSSVHIAASNLAELFLAQGFKAEAIAAFLVAEQYVVKDIGLDSHYGHRTFRSCVLSKTARLLDSEGARQVAIALLKISIAELERVRNVIGASSDRLGICFAKQNEDIYRSLASLLLDQGRVAEAEAVMAR